MRSTRRFDVTWSPPSEERDARRNRASQLRTGNFSLTRVSRVVCPRSTCTRSDRTQDRPWLMSGLFANQQSTHRSYLRMPPRSTPVSASPATRRAAARRCAIQYIPALNYRDGCRRQTGSQRQESAVFPRERPDAYGRIRIPIPRSPSESSARGLAGRRLQADRIRFGIETDGARRRSL